MAAPGSAAGYAGRRLGANCLMAIASALSRSGASTEPRYSPLLRDDGDAPASEGLLGIGYVGTRFEMYAVRKREASQRSDRVRSLHKPLEAAGTFGEICGLLPQMLPERFSQDFYGRLLWA